MTKAQRKQLDKAVELIDKANELICEVKNERKGVSNDDDFFALEDIEVRLYNTREDLHGHYINS
jgi:hypothetical protein